MVGRGCYYPDDCFDPCGTTYGPRRVLLKWGGSIEYGYDDPLDELAWGVRRFARAIRHLVSLPDRRTKHRKTPLWPPDPLDSPKDAPRPSEPPPRRPGRARGAKRPGLGLRNFRKVV
jgi:hypothetical protein